MYCPHCGSESATGLKFCKLCGGNLAATNPLDEKRSPSDSEAWQVWAVALATVAVCLGGLGIVFSTALKIMRPPIIGGTVGEPTLVASLMIAFGTTTVFAISAMLIRLFTRLLTRDDEKGHVSRSRARQSGNYSHAQLGEPPPGIASVTEHTTRNFDPLRFKEPGARERS